MENEFSEQCEFPKGNEFLFKPEKNFDTGVWLDRLSGDKFHFYSEGYMKAASVLYNHAMQDSEFYRSYTVYPMIFLYRQSLELRLKELLKIGHQYIYSNNDFADNHNLIDLWGMYRKSILPHTSESKEVARIDSVEKLLKEFNAIDPKSSAFRFPTTKKKKGQRKPSLNIISIDLLNFKKSIDKLLHYFNYQIEMLFFHEDCKQEMLSSIDGYWSQYSEDAQ